MDGAFELSCAMTRGDWLLFYWWVYLVVVEVLKVLMITESISVGFVAFSRSQSLPGYAKFWAYGLNLFTDVTTAVRSGLHFKQCEKSPRETGEISISHQFKINGALKGTDIQRRQSGLQIWYVANPRINKSREREIEVLQWDFISFRMSAVCN